MPEHQLAEMESRVEAMKSSVEFLKEMSSDHGTRLSVIKKCMVFSAGSEALSVLDLDSVHGWVTSRNFWESGCSKKVLSWRMSPQMNNIIGRTGEQQQRECVDFGWREAHLLARKVELPSFDGSNPLRWISRAEKLFEL
ncbi:hypothetical protein CR513_00924, partial [Mucuna pruriens]